MSVNIVTRPTLPANLQINWHPLMPIVPEFFSECPTYSRPNVLSERQELASRIHFNFHVIGCLFKSIENNPKALHLQDIYNFVFASCNELNQKIHNLACCFIGQTRSCFILAMIDLHSKNFTAFNNLYSKNFEAVRELFNEVNQIPPDEREGVIAFAIRILEDCILLRPRSLINEIRKIPLEEREEVVSLTLSLLTNKEAITRPHTLLNMIRRIPSHERMEILELAIPLFTRPLHSDEVLDRILETVHNIVTIPSDERAEVLGLAAHLFNEGFCTDDMERGHIIHEIYQIPSNERAEIVRLAKPILDPRRFRTLGIPINSEYAIYVASQEYSVLSAIKDIASEHREVVINLARSSFRLNTDNTTRARILRRIAQRIGR